MAIREGRWDCSNCLATRIKGREKQCPRCGDPRNPTLTPEEKPYLPSDAEEVTDANLLDLANAGPDWNCGHCGQANRGNVAACANCDRPRDADDTFNRVATYVEGKSAEGVELDSVTREEEERVDDLTSDDDEHEKLVSDNPDEPDRPEDLTLSATALRREGEIASRVDDYLTDKQERSRNPLSVLWEKYGPLPLLVAGGGVIVALIIWFVVGFFRTEPIQLEVQSLTWERQVEVEEFRTLIQEDWSLPSDGRLLESFQAIHHYDRVLDHYETRSRTVYDRVQTGTETVSYPCGSHTVDRGNGFFETVTEYCNRSEPVYENVPRTEYYEEAIYREDPVYRTKYRFEVDRWVFDHWETASGTLGEEGPAPYWPEPQRLESDQRLGQDREQEYVVILASDEGRTFRQEPEYDIWRSLEEGEDIVGHITRSGALRSVDWPEPDNE